jgi:hypothetical protein
MGPLNINMTASSPGKGVVPFPPGPPSGFLPLERATEIMKFFTMVHSLSMCLMGYAWFRLLQEVSQGAHSADVPCA